MAEYLCDLCEGGAVHGEVGGSAVAKIVESEVLNVGFLERRIEIPPDLVRSQRKDPVIVNSSNR